MKYRLICIAILVILLALPSVIAETVNEDFNNTYNGVLGTDSFSDVVITNDGHYIPVGVTTDGIDRYIWLVETDDTGLALNNVKSTYYSFDSKLVPATPGIDNGVLVVGYYYGTKIGFRFLKYDSNLSLNWTTTLEKSDDNLMPPEPYGIATASDGYVMVYNGQINEAKFTKINSTGAEVFTKSYGINIELHGITVNQSGNYVLVGDDIFAFPPSPMIIVTDTAGNNVTVKEYNSSAYLGFQPYSVVDYGGGYILAGHRYGAAFAMKVDYSLNVLATETWSGLGATNVTSDGTNIVFVSKINGTDNFKVFSTDSNFNEKWNFTTNNVTAATVNNVLLLAGVQNNDGLLRKYTLASLIPIVEVNNSKTLNSSTSFNVTVGETVQFIVRTSQNIDNWYWSGVNQSTVTGNGTNISTAYATFTDLGSTTVSVYGIANNTSTQTVYWNIMVIPPTIQVSWSKVFGSGEFYGVIKTSDGGYLFSGQTEAFGHGSCDVWLVKTDSNGNVLWNKTYGSIYCDQAGNAVEVDDGYVVIGTFINASDFNDVDTWFLKVSKSDGRILINRTYQFNGQSGVNWQHHVLKDTDGNIVAVGTDAGGGFIMKVDSDGNLIFKKSGAGTYNAIRLANNGTYIGLRGPYIDVFNKSGSIISTIDLGLYVTGDLRDVYQTPDGHFILAAEGGAGALGLLGADSFRISSITDGAGMLKTSGGSEIWERGFASESWTKARAILNTSENYAIIGLGDGISSSRLKAFDPDTGTVYWQVGISGIKYINDMIEIRENGKKYILLAGNGSGYAAKFYLGEYTVTTPPASLAGGGAYEYTPPKKESNDVTIDVVVVDEELNVLPDILVVVEHNGNLLGYYYTNSTGVARIETKSLGQYHFAGIANGYSVATKVLDVEAPGHYQIFLQLIPVWQFKPFKLLPGEKVVKLPLSWLFILTAYIGAFIGSLRYAREWEDWRSWRYDKSSTALAGTLAWTIPLILSILFHYDTFIVSLLFKYQWAKLPFGTIIDARAISTLIYGLLAGFFWKEEEEEYGL